MLVFGLRAPSPLERIFIFAFLGELRMRTYHTSPQRQQGIPSLAHRASVKRVYSHLPLALMGKKAFCCFSVAIS